MTIGATNANGPGTAPLVITITPPVFLSFPLDSNPGWTTQGQWAFGTPTGAGGLGNGNPDPISGATGSNVYGVNLNGDYSTTAGGPFNLTAGPFNFSGRTSTVLRFQRWLNTDYQTFGIRDDRGVQQWDDLDAGLEQRNFRNHGLSLDPGAV